MFTTVYNVYNVPFLTYTIYCGLQPQTMITTHINLYYTFCITDYLRHVYNNVNKKIPTVTRVRGAYIMLHVFLLFGDIARNSIIMHTER